jgi:hypothetical protein
MELRLHTLGGLKLTALSLPGEGLWASPWFAAPIKSNYLKVKKNWQRWEAKSRYGFFGNILWPLSVPATF